MSANDSDSLFSKIKINSPDSGPLDSEYMGLSKRVETLEKQNRSFTIMGSGTITVEFTGIAGDASIYQASATPIAHGLGFAPLALFFYQDPNGQYPAVSTGTPFTSGAVVGIGGTTWDKKFVLPIAAWDLRVDSTYIYATLNFANSGWAYYVNANLGQSTATIKYYLMRETAS